MGTGAAATTPPSATTAQTPTRIRRLIGAAVAVGAAGLLGVTALLEPSPTGLGTHSQLRLPACGWIATIGVPCPTCGMTTAFAHAADGNLLAAVGAQPMGAVLAVAVAVVLPIGAYVAVTGSPLANMFRRLWGRRAVWALAVGFGGAWIFKILSYKGWLA